MPKRKTKPIPDTSPPSDRWPVYMDLDGYLIRRDGWFLAFVWRGPEIGWERNRGPHWLQASVLPEDVARARFPEAFDA